MAICVWEYRQLAVWNLTGGRVHVTDPTNASRTMLFDLGTGDWDAELLRLLGVPPGDAAEGGASFGDRRHRCGGVRGGGADCGHRGRPAGGAVRPGLLRPGRAKNTYGTGCFLLLNAGPRRTGRRARAAPDAVACGPTGRPSTRWRASVFVGGRGVQWLRDGLG